MAPSFRSVALLVQKGQLRDSGITAPTRNSEPVPPLCQAKLRRCASEPCGETGIATASAVSSSAPAYDPEGHRDRATAAPSPVPQAASPASPQMRAISDAIDAELMRLGAGPIPHSWHVADVRLDADWVSASKAVATGDGVINAATLVRRNNAKASMLPPPSGTAVEVDTKVAEVEKVAEDPTPSDADAGPALPRRRNSVTLVSDNRQESIAAFAARGRSNTWGEESASSSAAAEEDSIFLEAMSTDPVQKFRQHLKMRFVTLRRAFKALDANAQGVLSFNDFKLALERLDVRWAEVTGFNDLQKLFKALDLHSSGELSQAQLMGVLQDSSDNHEEWQFLSTMEKWTRWCDNTDKDTSKKTQDGGVGVHRPLQQASQDISTDRKSVV